MYLWGQFIIMAVAQQVYFELLKEISDKQVTLVAVSKTKPTEDIAALYALGQRDFGENYVQELVDKQTQLPNDIRWHFIGHLQTNKVKYIAPFVYLIHGVDSLKLLKEIQKQAAKSGRIIKVLLQMHIATEETKFGLNEEELYELSKELERAPMPNIQICGMMGMASFSDDQTLVRSELKHLKELFNSIHALSRADMGMDILSMGMSADYRIAIEEGSTMIRIGSMLFGARGTH